MAYKLPSVFYVNDIEEHGDCILYHASKRNEIITNRGGFYIYKIVVLYYYHGTIFM